jgi:hypothetical protein
MKNKDIKDYLHLYLGCEVFDSDLKEYGVLAGAGTNGYHQITGNGHGSTYMQSPENIKPILRKLSSMTEEEAIEFKKLIPWIDFERFLPGDRWRYSEHEETSKHETRVVCHTSAGINTLPMVVMPFLLSKGFDLFGLIDSALAIEKK